jgi:hypothetical protein
MESLDFSMVERLGAVAESGCGDRAPNISDDMMQLVGRWSRATQSCETRQVRKEATVAGQCVCSGQLAPDFLAAQNRQFDFHLA